MSTPARVALSVAVAAALTALILRWGGVSLGDCLAVLSRLSLAAWAPVFALHLLLYLLRALRFAALMPPAARPRFGPFVGVNLSYTLASFVLPAKIGEAAFVLYSQRVCAVPATVGFAALVVSRLLDLAVLSAGFALACFALAASDAFPAIGWFVPLGAGLALVSTVVFWLSARSDLLAFLLGGALRVLGLGRTHLGGRIATRIGSVAGALRAAGGEGRLARAALLSVPIWIVIFLFCALLARALGLPAETTLAEATFGSSLAILTSMIPVSAFANFGTLELGWVLGFGILGVPRDLATATGLGLHTVQLVHVVGLGLLGHALMARGSGNR